MSEPILARSEWPHDALERVEGCPACGSRGSERPAYAHVEDAFGGAPGRWDVYECLSCASLYLDPRPSEHGLALAYRAYYTHMASTRVDGVTTDSMLGRLVGGYLSHRFGLKWKRPLAAGRWFFRLFPPLRQQLDYFLRHLPAVPGALLDVGCGNGAFLSRAVQAGWYAEGLEPDEAAADVARRSGCVVATATLETFRSSCRFDVITMSHVIEHVPEPYAALRLAFDLLTDGGTLWLATPNAAAPGRRRYGADWRGLEVPRHTVVFMPDALKALLERAGYESIRFHRRGRGASYSLEQSAMAANRRNVRVPRLSPWWVDLRAGCSPFAGEELVVTAKRRG